MCEVFLFINVALPVPLRKTFDYQIKADGALPQKGARVRVPFGNRTLIGIIWEINTQPNLPPQQIKPIIEQIDQTPLLTETLLSLCKFASQYYHHPIGEVLFSGLPKTLREGKSYLFPTNTAIWPSTFPSLSLNPEQSSIVSELVKAADQFSCNLIEGVTGSGKTHVYLSYLQSCLKTPGQILVLIPEIGLSSQTTQRFQACFGESVWFYHSQLGEKQRRTVWLNARAGIPGIYIGTRSALFLPFTQLKSIIVDEEHDASFKQQEGFKYHGRDLAIKYAQQLKIPILLGSATPSLISRYHAQQSRYRWFKLTTRANQQPLPTIQLVTDLKNNMTDLISPTLLKAMEKHLNDGHQVLLFLNRRGYAPVLLCEQCHHIAQCKRCDVKLVYHQVDKRLHCHHCQKVSPLPIQCPQCKHPNLLLLGAGTERLESLIETHFVKYPVFRIDSDSTRRKGALQSYLDEIAKGMPCILLGTQMLAKGHDFPQVTLAAILDIDAGLFSTDFNAIEQIGQLIIQVAGRAGRAQHWGEVLCQTSQPNHPLLETLLQSNYPAFSEALLKERQQTHLPPYTYLALFRSRANTNAAAEGLLKDLYQRFYHRSHAACHFLGPSPAPIAKKQGKYDYQLLLLASSRQALHTQITAMIQSLETHATHRARWSVEIDPIDLS